MERIYICIDLKTFYASVECTDRGLDPFKANLVVADASHGKGAICLAISPSLKALGIRNRCRLFEIPDDVPYIAALPRMARYIEVSADVYSIYLRYIAKEDIYPYSVDECFMDVTSYLSLYKMSYNDLAKMIIADVYQTTGITAVAGIGTNLVLAKFALDISSKHSPTNVAFLNEKIFKDTLWHHKPLTDFWQIGRGIAKRLLKYGIDDMYGIAHMDEAKLYKEFGVNAEYLIDHAWGRESCTIEDIKSYKSTSKSISNSQILSEDYNYEDTLLVLKEMVDLNCLTLVENQLVASSIFLSIGYSNDTIKPTGGSLKLGTRTNSFKILINEFIDLYKKTTNKDNPIRRIGLGFSVLDEAYTQYDIFCDPDELEKEHRLLKTVSSIKKKYGKNAILKGMNLEERATTKARNKLIGGHNAE